MSRLLLIEDDVFLSDAFSAKVGSNAFELKTASNGEEAYPLLASFKPDLIILDLIMPKQDGISFLKQIKSDEAFKDIPVIVASNLDDKAKIKEAKKLGAVDYYIKSNISIRDLVAKCKSYL